MTLPHRIEAAEGADRALDFWISVYVNGSEYTEAELQADIDLVGIECMVIDAPYTASIDAALTLVPEGWDYGAQDHRADGAYAEVWKHGYHDDTVIYAHAATPALALCAAALRAKEISGGE